LATLQSVLPAKNYFRRSDGERERDRSSPFARLLAKPSSVLNPVEFRTISAVHHHTFGVAFWRKTARDKAGRPTQLEIVHPSRMSWGVRADQAGRIRPESMWQAGDYGSLDGGMWWQAHSDGTSEPVPRRELVVWRRQTDDPSSPLAPIEVLRQTLEQDYHARASQDSLWRNGGHPMYVIKAPPGMESLMPEVITKMRDQWQDTHSHVDNWYKPLILENGMDVSGLTVDPKALEYLGVRKLHNEEIYAALDVPPPIVHELENATYSNIAELMKSLYKVIMHAHIRSYEATIDFDLRDGSFGQGEPDWPDEMYHELDVSGVLRPTPEEQMESLATAIQNGVMMPSEARSVLNLPFAEGSNQLFVNAAVVPIEEASRSAAGMDQRLELNQVRAVMGRLGRAQSLDDVDVAKVVAGLPPDAAGLVQATLLMARQAAIPLPEAKERIKELQA